MGCILVTPYFHFPLIPCFLHPEFSMHPCASLRLPVLCSLLARLSLPMYPTSGVCSRVSSLELLTHMTSKVWFLLILLCLWSTWFSLDCDLLWAGCMFFTHFLPHTMPSSVDRKVSTRSTCDAEGGGKRTWHSPLYFIMQGGLLLWDCPGLERCRQECLKVSCFYQGNLKFLFHPGPCFCPQAGSGIKCFPWAWQENWGRKPG